MPSYASDTFLKRAVYIDVNDASFILQLKSESAFFDAVFVFVFVNIYSFFVSFEYVAHLFI